MSHSKSFEAAFDIEAAGAPEVADVPVEATEEPVEQPAEEIEAEVPVAVEPAEEEIPVERLWAGKYKTPEDMESGLRELQSHKDREIAEVRAKVEAYESLLAGGPEPEPETVEVSQEQLALGAQQAPVDTFHWTMQNRPDLVPALIGMVRDHHDNVTADQMQATFQNAITMAQQQQMMNHFDNQMQQAFAPAQQQQAIAEGLSRVEEHYGEDFNSLREETAAELQKLGGLESYDPDTISLAVEYAFLRASRAAGLAAPSASPTPSPQEFVETGTPGQAVLTPTGADKLRDEVAAEFKKMWM